MWKDLLRETLVGVGRVGGRATAAAADSVLKDGLDTLDEAQRRIKKFRKGIADVIGAPAPKKDDP